LAIKIIFQMSQVRYNLEDMLIVTYLISNPDVLIDLREEIKHFRIQEEEEKKKSDSPLSL
jgi:hypothetical protein